MRSALAIVVVLGACGRIGFREHVDASAAGADTRSDVASDAPAVPFCTQNAGATFCSDFDDGTTSGFNSNDTTFGNFDLDSEAVSPPWALHAVTNTVSTGQVATVYAGTQLLNMVTHVVLSCAVYIDVAGSNDAVLIQISMNDGNGTHDFELVDRAPPGLSYVEDANTPSAGGPTYAYYTGPVIANGAWHDVVIDFTAGASAHFTLSIDASTVIDMVPTYTTGGQLLFKVGLPYVPGPGTGWVDHVDNVLLNAQ